MASATYDYVIVGGGSAGSALANRLSADPATRVLVLEAGISGPPLGPDHQHARRARLPGRQPALRLVLRDRARAATCRDRRMRQPRGKILGGSSSINGMMYHRGHPADFDQWAAETGEPGWDYAHLLPYFQRHEHVLTADPDGIRGHAGPQVLEPAEATGPALRRVLRRGPPGRTPGHHQHQRPRPGGRRPRRAHDPQWHGGSRRRAPTSRRSARAPTSRCAAGSRSAGCCMEGTARRRRLLPPGSGPEERVFAGEIVLCGGAMGTPHVLQLSGIGPTDVLERVGVRVVARPARRRGEPGGPPRGAHAAPVREAGVAAGDAQEVPLARDRGAVAAHRHRPGCQQPPRGHRLLPQRRDAGPTRHHDVVRRAGDAQRGRRRRSTGTATRCTSA